MQKIYISAQSLLEDSFSMGKQILESDFSPNFIVGVWRGGTPVGIAVQEMLAFFWSEIRPHRGQNLALQGHR